MSPSAATDLSHDFGPPVVERFRGGRRFVNKPYFPCYCANGVDALLIDLHGSGNATWDEFDFSPPNTQLLAKGWHRTTWRCREGSALPYGRMVPMLEVAARAVLHGDQPSPTDARQYLDARRGVIHSLLTFRDAESDTLLELRVDTWMMRRGVLAERVMVLATPQGLRLRFRLNAPSNGYLELTRRPDEVVGEVVDAGRDRPCLRTRWADLTVTACSWLVGRAWGKVEHGALPGEGVWVNYHTPELTAGQSVTRCTGVMEDEASSRLRRLARAVDRVGTAGLRRHHRRCVARPKRRKLSSVDFGDAAINHAYEVSRYCLESIQHPSGFTPMGLLPYQWQGTMFGWDSSFVAEALMSSGDAWRAERLLAHLLSRRGEAEALAGRLGRPGARMEWTMGLSSFDPYDPPTAQVHNQSSVARCVLRIAEHVSPDRLVSAGDMAEALLDCLASYVFESDGRTLAALSGPDESTTNLKSADTWTLANFIAAMRQLRPYRPSDKLDHWERILTDELNANIDGDGVLQSFRGGRRPHWGSLVFDILPDHPAREATLDRMADNRDARLDTVNYHAVMHYPERQFPWCSLWVARIRARHGDARALPLIREALRFVNSHGALPERVYYHGERFVQWMLSAHATYLWAANTAMAFAPGEHELRLFGGLPEDGVPRRFDRVDAGHGLKVSAAIEAGSRLSSLDIQNNGHARELKVFVHQQTTARVVHLGVGDNHVVLNEVIRA